MVRTVKSSKKTYEILKKIRSFQACVFSNKIKGLLNLNQSQSPRSPLVHLLIFSVATKKLDCELRTGMYVTSR